MNSPLKALLAVVMITVLYCWVSADEWEEELRLEQEAQARAQALLEQKQALAELEQEPEFEPDWSKVGPTEFMARPIQSVKKTSVKAKKRVKRALSPAKQK